MKHSSDENRITSRLTASSSWCRCRWCFASWLRNRINRIAAFPLGKLTSVDETRQEDGQRKERRTCQERPDTWHGSALQGSIMIQDLKSDPLTILPRWLIPYLLSFNSLRPVSVSLPTYEYLTSIWIIFSFTSIYTTRTLPHFSSFHHCLYYKTAK